MLHVPRCTRCWRPSAGFGLQVVENAPTRKGFRRGASDDVTATPLTTLLRATRDDGSTTTVLHLAASVEDNLPAVQLVCARLAPNEGQRRDGAGRTALDVTKSGPTAVYLAKRFPVLQSPDDAYRMIPWICEVRGPIPRGKGACGANRPTGWHVGGSNRAIRTCAVVLRPQ